MRLRVWGAAVLAALVIAPGAPRASPVRLFGYGGRSPGMAGAGVASSADFECVYLNPAGLADVRRKRLTLGGLAGDFALELDGEDTGTDGALGLAFGAVLPLPLGGAARDRVALGFGLYVPDGTLNRVNTPFPGTPFYALLDSTSHVIAIQVATGVRLPGGWRAGAGVIALATLRGRIHVNTDAAGRFTTSSEQELEASYAPVVGVRRPLGRAVTVGAVLRGVSRSGYDIAISNDLEDELPIGLPPIRIAGTPQYDPLTVAAEAAWRPRPDLLVSGQLAWERWSAYPLPSENPTDGTPPQEPPGFHDTVVPRAAVEWTRRASGAELQLRAGYAFQMTPAPEMDGPQSLLDNHRHVVALGAGVHFPRAAVPLHVNAWVQAHRLVARTHTKDPDRFTAGDPPPFDTLATGGGIVAAGVTLGVNL